MLEFTVAADIGSSETRLATRTQIKCEETRAALDPLNGNRILALGRAARDVLDANSAFPVRGGISDVPLAAVMLRRFALGLLKRRSLFGVGLRLAVPLSAKPTDLAAALETGREAGFMRVAICDALSAGMLGAGLDTEDDRARLLIDVGRERVNMLAAAGGGVILEKTAPFGSSVFDRHIQAHFAMERNMLVSFHAAECIKKGLDKPFLRVHGRDASNGQPLMRTVSTRELREALASTLSLIAGEITAFIECLPPDAAGDLVDTGAVLIGGGSRQYGLAKGLSELLGIPAVSAPNGRNAVIAGMQAGLRNEDIMRLRFPLEIS